MKLDDTLQIAYDTLVSIRKDYSNNEPNIHIEDLSGAEMLFFRMVKENYPSHVFEEIRKLYWSEEYET